MCMKTVYWHVFYSYYKLPRFFEIKTRVLEETDPLPQSCFINTRTNGLTITYGSAHHCIRLAYRRAVADNKYISKAS